MQVSSTLERLFLFLIPRRCYNQEHLKIALVREFSASGDDYKVTLLASLLCAVDFKVSRTFKNVVHKVTVAFDYCGFVPCFSVNEYKFNLITQVLCRKYFPFNPNFVERDTFWFANYVHANSVSNTFVHDRDLRPVGFEPKLTDTGVEERDES